MSTVDIVVPCYNYGRYLKDCIGSVLAQQGVQARILIIDNCSTDDSLSIARELAAQHPEIEFVAHDANRGATFSYNEGIDWASSDYFLILDADDVLAPGALARAVALLDNDPQISFTHGIEARLQTDGFVGPFDPPPAGPEWTLSSGQAFIERLCRTPVNSIGANTVIRRTSAQKQVGYYRAALRYTDDLEMWLRLATVGSVASIRQVQAIRRYHDQRMSVHYQSVQLRDFIEREAAFESFFAHEGKALTEAAQLRGLARKGLGEHAYWSAVSHFWRGYGGVGRQLLQFSHERRPRAVLLPPIQWLLRMDRPMGRMGEIASEALSFHRMGDLAK
ncbi:MAG: glycosyltransferase family 2 protein [Phyllobacterium sp.]